MLDLDRMHCCRRNPWRGLAPHPAELVETTRIDRDEASGLSTGELTEFIESHGRRIELRQRVETAIRRRYPQLVELRDVTASKPRQLFSFLTEALGAERGRAEPWYG